MSSPGLSWPTRVRVWDAALAAVRAYLRGSGLVEVTTPTRVDAGSMDTLLAQLPSLEAAHVQLGLGVLLAV